MLNIKTKLRRAFTIVELVVVIAVIAALAAILIPTFANVINAANESADTSLVRNINTILYSEQAINGAPSTFSEVLELASENGYNIDKLTPSSNGDIVWDQASNRFLLIDEDGEVVYQDGNTSSTITSSSEKYQLWYIASSDDDLNGGYSYYLNYEYSGDSITVTTGLDVGDNEGIDVTYSTIAAQDVIINTNGGSLTVSAANSSLAHYGNSDSVLISAVKSESYHLYGYINGNLTVYSGRVVAESGSKISTVLALNTSSATVKVEVSAGSDVGSVKTQGTVTTNIASSTSTTESEVTDEEIEILRLFAGGTGESAETAYEISTEAELRALSVLDMSKSSNYYYFKLVKDITLNRTSDEDYILDYFNGVFDGNGYSITVAIADGATVTGGDNWGYGSYWFFSYPINATIKDLTIFHTSGANISITYGWKYSYSTLIFDNVDMGNQSVRGTSLGMARNASGYVQYFSGSTLTFNECDNWYNLYSNDPSCYSAVYVGGYYRGSSAPTVTYTNCINYGSVKGSYVAIFVGNSSQIADKNSSGNGATVVMSGCENYGEISYFISGGLYSSIETSVADLVSTTVASGCENTAAITSLNDTKLAIKKASDNTYTVTKANNSSAYTYKILYMGSASWTLGTLSGSQYMTLAFELDLDFGSDGTASTTYKSGVKFYDVDSYLANVSGASISSVTWSSFSQVDGCKYFYDSTNNCYVFDYSGTGSGKTYTMGCGSTVYVAIYDQSGNLIGLKVAS